MKNTLHCLFSAITALSMLLLSLPATSVPVAAKSYGSWQMLMAFDVDMQECWVRPRHEAWYSCAEWEEYQKGTKAFTALTGRTIEYVWPRTLSYTPFSLPSEGSLLMEVVLEKDAKHSGWLEYTIERYDEASGKWVSAGWYWKTLVQIDNGKQSYAENAQYDLSLLTADSEGKPWHPVLKSFPLYPAGKYRLFAWEPVWGQLDAYQPAKGSFAIIFMPKGAPSAGGSASTGAAGAFPCNCTNKSLCNDSDGDGVRDWEDLCNGEKGTASANGCITTSWLDALNTSSEVYLREQVKKFLSCQRTIDADKAAAGIKFNFNGADPEYNQGILSLNGSMLKAFWRAEKEAACTGKTPSLAPGEGIYGSLYHELGHYFADEAEAGEVTGAGGGHDTWQESNPGLAFDEARADLVMNLMGRYFSRETKEEADYGQTAYRNKIGSQDPNKTSGAVASLLIDLLPSDPCVALDTFMQAQASFVRNHGSTKIGPQNIQDWLIGLNLNNYDGYKMGRQTLAQYVQADARTGDAAKKYGMKLPVGSPYKCVNASGVSGVEFDSNGMTKKYLLDPQVNNVIGFEGEACTVEILFSGQPLKITQPHSDYEVEIAGGVVTVRVNSGSVMVVLPDGKQVPVQQGGSFTYRPGATGSSTGTSSGAGTQTGLPANGAALRDYDKSGDSFSLSRGKTCSGCNYSITDEDFFIADRNAQSIIHAFESPGVIDMGAVALESVKEAPASGYLDSVTPAEGHTYVFKSRGRYSKIYITAILRPPAREITTYEFSWACQPNGTRSFATSSSGTPQTKSGSTGAASNPLLKTVSKFCPVSAAYGSTEDSRLAIFRRFRDRVLAGSAAGRELIGIYYAAAPAVVDLMDRCGFLVPVVRYSLAEPAALVLNGTEAAWNY